jgi:phosphoribosylanthranilate isomerase
MGFKNWWNALAFLRDLRANYSQDMARLGGMIREVSSQHHVDVIALNARIDQLDKLVKDRTDIAVDFGYKDSSHVIVIGRYRNLDYVQTYRLDDQEFVQLIDRLRAMERHGIVRRLDAPPVVRAVFERDVHDL